MADSTNTPLPEGIYFEYAPAAFSFLHGYQHSYLVYRDGQGNAEVVRGGLHRPFVLASEIKMEIGVPLADSSDEYDPGETPADRHSTLVDIDGRDPGEVWEQAKQVARQIDPDVDYDLYTDRSKLPEIVLGDGGPIQNSNSVVGTVLDGIGVDWRDAIPPDVPASLLPGIETDLLSPDVDKGILDEFVDDVTDTFDSWVHGDNGRDPFFIDGYRYNPEDGQWYSAPPAPDYGQFSWQGKASPEIQAKLAAERQLRMEEAQSQDERQSLLDNESTYPNPHLTENNDLSAMPTIPDATSSTPGAPNSPEWQADVTPPPASGPAPPAVDIPVVSYTVQTGDSLWVIAKQTGVPFDQVLAANQHLENPDLIFPGQKVNIPAAFVDSDGFINAAITVSDPVASTNSGDAFSDVNPHATDNDAEYSYLAVGNEEEIAEYEQAALEGNADTVYAYSGAVNSAWNFYGALEGDNTLAKVNAGVGLTRSLERIEGIDFGDDTSATLGNVGYGLGAAMGTIRFFDALEDGNVLGAASAGLSTAAQIGQLANISKLSGLSSFAGPVGMITSVAAGDPIGAMSSMLMTTGNPYLMAAGVVLSVFNSIGVFGEEEPYEAPTGEGHFFRTEDGDIGFTASGTAGNQADHVQASLLGRFGELDSELTSVPTGDEIVRVALEHTLDKLQDQLPQELAIIPERLPSLSFNGFFYIASLKDATTGASQQMAVPRTQVMETLESAAYYSQAVVPEWEAATINARLDAGDPYYWHTEGQRAHHGLDADLVAPALTRPQDGGGDEATNPTPGHPLGEGFTPIVVDLNGDGIATTQSVSKVLFDVDNDGYLEETNWVAPQDGLLSLDRNGDGRIDHASELFANPALGSAYRGLGGLAYLDANQDGIIDETDPVFNSLTLWQDHNVDAVSQPHELISLTQAGISSLAYAAQVGSQAEGIAPAHLTTEAGLGVKLLQITLDATDQGLRLTDLPGGTLVDPEGSEPFFYVTATHTPGSAYSLPPTTVMQEIKAMTLQASRHPFGETSVGLLAVGAGLSAAPAAAGPTTTLGASPLAHPAPVRGDPPPPADLADPQTLAGTIVTTLGGDDSRIASDPAPMTTGSPAPAPLMAPPETALPTGQTTPAGPPEALPPLTATPAPGAPPPVSHAGQGAFDPVVALTTFAGPDHLTIFEDITTKIPQGLLLANDNGQGLAIASVDNPTHGTVDFDQYGNIRFLPESNYYGEARFDYIVQDNAGRTATATAFLTINPVNDAPDVVSLTDNSRPYWTVNYGEGDRQTFYEAPARTDERGRELEPPPPSGHTVATAGQILATDVDDTLDSLIFSMGQHPVNGSASLNPTTGAWSYSSTPCHQYTGPDPFSVNITDPHGATTEFTIEVRHQGSDCSDGKKPLVIDLNGDGISIVGVDDSTVFFDVNDDGYREHIAWAGPEDGLLAYDKDGDGVITDIDEIAFTSYLDGARTDLEGLKGFDTNDDDIFSKLDDKWGEFGIWQDINQDGITDAGEFQSLDHHGITQIDLESDHQHQVYDDGTVLFGTTTYQTEDGTEGLVGDVRLAYDPETVIPAETPLTAAETLAQADNPTQTAATPGPEDAELNRIVDQLRADMAAFDSPPAGALPGEADVDPTADMMNTNQIDDEQEYTQP